ncbi:hypothetical protein [Borrelia persica]|uniref:hypothetical protein n=1 Tax=Borrelia persica TaxID=44448 RepID=UPI001268A89D|nr:hypothetical protein [Borrelia persica]
MQLFINFVKIYLCFFYEQFAVLGREKQKLVAIKNQIKADYDADIGDIRTVFDRSGTSKRI